MLVAGVLLLASNVFAGVSAVGSIGLTVADLDREITFYTTVLPFKKVGAIATASGPETDRYYGLTGVQTRSAILQLGVSTITLTEFVSPKGRAIPADSRSFDHWFQHIAIVVRNMEAAYAVLAKAHVRHVSTAPQTLPLSNPNAGGIKAFYFQDPEGHVLEIIWFPKGKGDPRWQQWTDELFLGIDHTAIAVGDTEASLRFYRDTLGLHVTGESENYGPEQEHLNHVFGARVRITGLRAASGPGIEFLEYLTPGDGRAFPADAHANDAIHWQTTLLIRSAGSGAQAFTDISRLGLGGSRARVVRDPDGHTVQLTEP